MQAVAQQALGDRLKTSRSLLEDAIEWGLVEELGR
jgi:hypothetical protein